MKYYAVKNGRKIGIFETWDECKAQVDGYSGAEYKSFTAEADALAFMGVLEKKESRYFLFRGILRAKKLYTA